MKQKITVILTALILCMNMAVPTFAERNSIQDEGLALVCPSAAESMIAPGRDFYVIGTYDESLDVSKIVISLKAPDGTIVRSVRSGDTDFDVNHEGLNAFNPEQDAFLMPDLLYDKAVPGSYKDAFRKCYFKEGSFFALISGGAYESDIALKNEDGSAFAPITEGTYKLTVTAETASGTSNVMEQDITFAYSSDKVLARFTPDNHLNNVKAEAEKQQYRIYLDPFAGYWSPSSFMKGQADNAYFAEFVDRWQFGDALEYKAGKVHFYIYNVKPSSTTHSVEIATLQSQQAIDDRLVVSYYDIGEPAITYRDLNEPCSTQPKTLTGNFTALEKGDALQYTRAELVAGDAPDDNTYTTYGTPAKIVDTDPVTITEADGQNLILYGVVPPIQNKAEDIEKTGAAKYNINNLISSVNYEIYCDDALVSTQSHQVGLTRGFAEDWTDGSIYEFSHVIALPEEHQGHTMKVVATAYDSHEAVVSGGTETLYITNLPPDSEFSDVSTASDYGDYIYYLTAAKIMRGKGGSTFDPQSTLTKAEFITILKNLSDAKNSVSAATDLPFTDVSSRNWYYSNVCWAYNKGLLDGTADSFQLSPNAPITVAEMNDMSKKASDAGIFQWNETNVVNPATDAYVSREQVAKNIFMLNLMPQKQ